MASPAPALKLAPTETTPAEATPPPAPKRKRAWLRLVLLVVVPLIAAAAGLGFYLMTGRYITTDNAYVGAQKVLITPDVSGKVINVFVHEGQHVKPGDKLLQIDPEPYQLALIEAKGKLAAVRVQFDTLKANLKQFDTLVDLAHKNIDLKRADVERKQKLLSNNYGSQADRDAAASALVTAQLQAQLAEKQKIDAINQLLGNPDLPIEQFPAFVQAKAAVDKAQWDLDHTTLTAPISGTATQVDNIQLGRFVMAAGPILSVIDDAHPWVDANPKETDITYLRVGQKVEIDVDTFPDHTFHGTVAAVSPGTGAQFSILPPQNANGNWVKVVQRVPVRIQFDPDDNLARLRAGMSVYVSIDTGRQRSLATLLGWSSPRTAGHATTAIAAPKQ
jgi:membrane fusion protein (multidrug efflux system)